MADATNAPLTGPGGKPEWAMSRRERERAILARHGIARRSPWPRLLLVLLVAGVLAGGAWAWRAGLLPGAGAGGPRDTEAEASGPDRGAAPSPEAGPEAPRPLQVNAGEYVIVEPQTLQTTVKVLGPLAPARRADLSAEVSGTVAEVAAQPGDAVEEGQVLVRLDVERLALDLSLAEANLDSTRAQLALAEGQLARAQGLVERGVAAESTLADPEGNVASLRASLAAQEDQVAAARLALDGAEVAAPFDGVVQSRAVDPGAVVSAGTPLLALVDLSEVEMLAAAPIAAGARIRPGQAVDVTVDGLEGAALSGEVARVAPVAEEGTRTLTVYVRMGNPDGTLLGGMFATGRIVTAESRDALAVPTAAVLRDDDGPYVHVIADGALARRAVTPGPEWEGGLTEIEEGLAAGDLVVASALSGVEDGRAVELVDY